MEALGGVGSWGQGRWRERPGGGEGMARWVSSACRWQLEMGWRDRRAPGASVWWGGRHGERGLRWKQKLVENACATDKRCTYDSPGLLVCSFFLSRLGFLSSSVFFQCLFSFRLICLERKRQGVFL